MVFSDLHRKLPEAWVAESKDCAPGVKSARCLVNIQAGSEVPVRILNVNAKPVRFREGTDLCPLQEVGAVIEDTGSRDVAPHPDLDSALAEHIRKIVSGVHPDVTDADRADLEKLSFDFSDILSRDEYNMSLTDLIEHDIDTGQERPVHQQLRKTPMAHHQIVEAHIQRC